MVSELYGIFGVTRNLSVGRGQSGVTHKGIARTERSLINNASKPLNCERKNNLLNPNRTVHGS